MIDRPGVPFNKATPDSQSSQSRVAQDNTCLLFSRSPPAVGAYRDDDGKPVVLNCVREGERRIMGNKNME